ncbi:5'-nucleotidase SurE [Halomicronema hongdechloris C2206]|uniref:5'-nucleotidase SurE n=1 Tax=Halomicronema hongdechloris C2206 TaxID=1641165 RepID=A0A1Z3HLX3_9CYAN|nr:5'/3'-nucleotidase SurE [Halomicronema hongdechloris]ASC71294.1 5'-nucleotidase SurE [Halomicronema hongdechloris C2206]
MNILISNDDGIFAQGIRTLANTLAAANHQVTVVCPDRERSATGHGLTLHKPIRADQVESVFHSRVDAWACSGTPADCVKLGLGAILDHPPDIVLAGINHGPNLGTDVLYSGTVSAAMEGIIEGIPAIAFSLASFSCQDFQPAANFAQHLLKRLGQTPLTTPLLLNVNVPAISEAKIKGVQITRQGIRRYVDLFEKRVDPRGKTYYWLAGEVLEETHDKPLAEAYPPEISRTLTALPVDVDVIQDQCITVTPLHYNLTSLVGLQQLQGWMS